MTCVFACSASRVSLDEARIRTMITSLAGVAAPRRVGRRDNLTRGNVGRIKDWGGTGGETVYPPITCTSLVQPHRRHEALGRKTRGLHSRQSRVWEERPLAAQEAMTWQNKFRSLICTGITSRSFWPSNQNFNCFWHFPPIRPKLLSACTRTDRWRKGKRGKNTCTYTSTIIPCTLSLKKKNLIWLKYGVSRRQ